MDFPITLATNSKVPPSRQLTRELRRSIRQGRLSPGQHLPSTRELADSLSISRATVVKAYRRLLTEGILETQVGSGTYVRRDLSLYKAALPLAATTTPRPTYPGPTNLSRALLDVEIPQSNCPTAAELRYGCSAADLLPIRQWREVFNRHCRLVQNHGRFRDAEMFGYRPLREALATFLRKTKAVNCTADQIILFSGSQIVLNAVASVMVKENDLVIVENPGFAGTRSNLATIGARLETIDVDQNGIRADALDRIGGCKLACVSLSHQDPTGAIMSLDRRKKLLDWANSTNAYIFEDAWDSDYHYGSPALPSLQGMDRNERVLYAYSFWKVLFPIVTTGVLVVPDHLVDTFAQARSMQERPFAPIEHYALTDFIHGGDLECHIGRSRAIYESRRQALIFNLARSFKSMIAMPRFSAGLHQIVRFQLPLSETQILQCAKTAALPLIPTSSYYLHDAVPLEFLIPFSMVEKDSIPESIALFRRHD